MSFPHLVRDGLLPHRVRRLYLNSSNVPSVWVDTTGHGMETKLAALRCHVSQNAHTDESQVHTRERAAVEGRVIGTAAAEAFRDAGAWIELTTLIIPGRNDGDAELRRAGETRQCQLCLR